MKYPEYESQLFHILRNGIPTVSNTESEYQDLTFNKLFLYFETMGVPLNRRTFKKNLGLLTTDGKYNLLTQLLSDDCHLPIRFAVFAGTDKASAMYSVKEFGYTCILYSLDQILDYGKLLNIPQADERNRHTVRKEVPLFSASAFEEAVINAFVTNYSSLFTWCSSISISQVLHHLNKGLIRLTVRGPDDAFPTESVVSIFSDNAASVEVIHLYVFFNACKNNIQWYSLTVDRLFIAAPKVM